MNGTATPLEHLTFKVNNIAGAETDDDTGLLQQLHTAGPLRAIIPISPEQQYTKKRMLAEQKRSTDLQSEKYRMESCNSHQGT